MDLLSRRSANSNQGLHSVPCVSITPLHTRNAVVLGYGWIGDEFPPREIRPSEDQRWAVSGCAPLQLISLCASKTVPPRGTTVVVKFGKLTTTDTTG
jgi:hypothetical protein